ncbi:hypothetical protein QF011_003455 [Curtobacterium flaccumfaciens]|nr:hypothetical protein [Curtobacterium flaccumfaciens]
MEGKETGNVVSTPKAMVIRFGEQHDLAKAIRRLALAKGVSQHRLALRALRLGAIEIEKRLIESLNSRFD